MGRSVRALGAPPRARTPTSPLFSLALLFRLKQHAMASCKAAADAYAHCCTGRTLSTVWACRAELAALSACLSTHTNDRSMAVLKARWLAAGSPDHPDWGALCEGL